MWFLSGKRSRGQRQGTGVADRVVEAASQPLEPRMLLAGNAVVSMRGNQLRIVGDAADNAVELTVIGGNVVVRGIENTTLNGGTENFVVATGTDTIPGNVLIRLGAGNDTVLFSRNVQIAGKTVVAGSRGDDSIGSTGATFQRGLLIYGFHGENQVSLVNTTVAGWLWMRTRSGDDIVSLDGVEVNGRMKIRTGGGDDNVVLNEVRVTGKATVHTEANDDNVAVRDSEFDRLFRVHTRQNEDVVVLQNNTFNGRTEINTGRNVDAVLIREVNTFNRNLWINAGDGHFDAFGNPEAVELANSTVTNARVHIRKQESSTVPPAKIATRIDNPTTGAFALAEATNQFFADLLVSTTQPLQLDLSQNETESSVGDVLLTRAPEFVIRGSTTPFATVELDTNGDGQFDNQSVVADEHGAFAVTVTLSRSDLMSPGDQRNGFQTISLQSTDDAGDLQTAAVNVDLVQNSVVRFATSQGTFDLELFDDLVPGTVANFLAYGARYQNSIIHRSVSDFVIQGGGFTINGGVISSVPTDAPITNEYSGQTSNIRGTLSMALVGGDANSGTSQWFINTANNANLDAVPHTVFGRVVGQGMTVVDTIADLPASNLAAATGVGALTDVPLRTPFIPLGDPLTGTVSTTANSNLITGTNTRFTQELHTNSSNPGGSRSQISIEGQVFEVVSISSDTELLVSTAPTTNAVSVQARTSLLDDTEFVQFSSISEILDTI